MKNRYEKADRFTMTETALENYGEDHRGKVYVVDARYTDDHPGYDPNGGPFIYDVKGLNFALYPYEMEAA